MDEIIQKIISFEKKAQAVVGEAREERQAYEDMLRAELDAYRDKIIAENKAKIGELGQRVKREADESVKHIEDAAKLKIIQMHRSASGMRDGWIERLYNNIVGGGAQ